MDDRATGGGARRLLDLPAWAEVNDRRCAHIARVVLLLEDWAGRLAVDPDERRAWTDAARFHDAVKDASDRELLRIVQTPLDGRPLHGPAAAEMMRRHGESRPSVLEAVRHHTLGSAAWDRTGRALYMADFLEPGRNFQRRRRAFLARHVPDDFAAVFREVVRLRIQGALDDDHALYPESVELWNAVT